MDAGQYFVPYREPLASGTLLLDGQVRLGPVIGEGGFSLIYEGVQRPGRLSVAIKEFFPQGCWREDFEIRPGNNWSEADLASGVENFLQEGEILERLDHPGIVRILGRLRLHQTAYLIEELVVGSSLAERLQEGRPLPLEEVLSLLEQMGEALTLIHEAGLVHADVKPENLLITDSGRCVLIDFGSAHGYLEDLAIRSNQAAVSPGYSPLEQYQKKHRLTPAADVYALAATVYHMLHGQPPPDARVRSRGAGLAGLSGVAARFEEPLAQALHLHPLCRTPGVAPFLQQMGLGRKTRGPRSGSFRPFSQRGMAHLGATRALALCLPGGKLFSGGRDGRICASSWPDLRPGYSFQAHVRGGTSCLAVSADGHYLVSGSDTGSIKLWSTQAKGDPVWLVVTGPRVQALRFHPQEGTILAALADGQLLVLRPDQPVESLAVASDGLIGLDLDRAGEHLLLGTGGGQIVHWSLTKKRSLARIQAPEGQLHSLRFTPDGSGALTSLGENLVCLWDLLTGQRVRSYFGHRQEVWDAQVSSEPDVMVTASADHSLYGFRLDTGRMTLVSRVPEGMSGALVLDPRHRLLACGCADGGIRCWEF